VSRSAPVAVAGVLAAATLAALWLREREGAAEAAREAEALRKRRADEERTWASDRKEILSRMDVLVKRADGLETAARARDADLQAARAEVERLRRAAEEEVRRREAPRMVTVPPPVVEPVVEKVKEPPPAAPALGPAAVTDAKQVEKLVSGLNTLLAGVGGAETYRIVSAGAAEDDRLVKVHIEARSTDGTVAKAFRAGEARFVLQGGAGTLSIKLKDGSVTYPGDRTIPFPGGAYVVLLAVDGAPFRASGNPLLSIQ
jgi:hypothetical protein